MIILEWKTPVPIQGELRELWICGSITENSLNNVNRHCGFWRSQGILKQTVTLSVQQSLTVMMKNAYLMCSLSDNVHLFSSYIQETI